MQVSSVPTGVRLALGLTNIPVALLTCTDAGAPLHLPINVPTPSHHLVEEGPAT